MKAKRFNIIAILIIVVLLLTTLLTACSSGTAAPTTTPGGTATAKPTATTKPTATAQPAGKVYKWNMQGLNSPGTEFFTMSDEALATKIEFLTNGQVIINPFGPGGIVPFGDTMNSVQQGTLDVGNWWTCYDLGMRPVTALWGTMPFGFNNNQEYNDWMLEWGGFELAQECYAEWNIDIAGTFSSGAAQIAGQTREEYKTYKDMKGKIFRSSGLAAEVLQSVGLQTVFLPAGELFTAIERGTIDVVEFAGPSWNFRSAYHEVAPYVIGPGWHEPASNMMMLVNHDRFTEIGADLQKDIWAAYMWFGMEYGAWSRKDDIIGMEKMLDYGCVWNRLPDDDLQILHDAWYKISDKKAEEDPLYKRTWESYKTYKVSQDKINSLNWDLSFDRVAGLPDKIVS